VASVDVPGLPRLRPSGVAVAAAAAFAGLLWSVRALGETAEVVSGVGLLAASLTAAVCCWRTAARTAGRVGATWTLLGWAAFAWAGGQAVWTWLELVREVVAFPSAADVGYTLALPLTVAALLRLPNAPTSATARLRSLVDGVLVGLSLLLVSWVLVLRSVVETAPDELLARVLLFTYPVGDVVVITLVVHALLRLREAPGTAVPVLAVGAALSAVAVADTAFAYLNLRDAYTSGNLIDAFWLMGWALLAAAAREQGPAVEQPPSPVVRPIGLVLPYAAVLVATVVSTLALALEGAVDPFVNTLRSVLILALLLRQVLALRENLDLTSHLERRVEERTAELEASRARFEALVQHSHDVTTIIDREGVVRYQSASGARVFGHGTEVVGRPYVELVEPADVPRLQAALDEVTEEPLRATSVALRLSDCDGRGVCDIETTLTNLLDEPSVGGIVLNSRDVSERQALERRLVHEATHDALTGLANRALFEQRVTAALQRAQGTPGQVAVIFLDLDGFKAVNDSLGHDAGDQLLCQVAARLRSCVRGTDLVARLGGDEFAVLLEGVEGEARAVELTARLTARLRHTVVLEGREIAVQGSVGVAVAQGREEPGELLRNADLAMYRAKATREGGHAVFDPSMHADLVERLDLEVALRQALRDHPVGATGPALAVHYQPVVALASGELVAVEALARWTDPHRGPVPPAVFVPIAEESGLIHDLGRFVLEQACAQARVWRDEKPDRPLSVTVNLSTRQLERDEVVDELRDVLSDTGLPAEALVLEMTESVLLEHTDGVRARLQRIRDLGVRLAVDDFGTGYSSLSYLHRFPMDVLKIDRSFVGRLGGSLPEDALVPTIVGLAAAMRLTAVAEGVENARQVLALRRIGCEFGQGYHFAPPVPAHRFAEVAAELSRRRLVA
jgi:diguanylate cyclase (GGDEF)-like protein/PAS domain S-box-containing protein